MLRRWNPVMQRLLRSPFHRPWSRWFAVVEWTGRKSGRRYSTPVSYLKDGPELLITTGDRWWKNLVGGARISVWLNGRQRSAMAEPVLDERQSLALHERMFATRPFFARLAGIGHEDQRLQVLHSIRAGRTLIRVIVDPELD